MVNLEKISVVELRKKAAAKKISGRSTMNKMELVHALRKCSKSPSKSPCKKSKSPCKKSKKSPRKASKSKSPAMMYSPRMLDFNAKKGTSYRPLAKQWNRDPELENPMQVLKPHGDMWRAGDVRCPEGFLRGSRSNSKCYPTFQRVSQGKLLAAQCGLSSVQDCKDNDNCSVKKVGSESVCVSKPHVAKGFFSGIADALGLGGPRTPPMAPPSDFIFGRR